MKAITNSPFTKRIKSINTNLETNKKIIIFVLKFIYFRFGFIIILNLQYHLKKNHSFK